MNDAGLNDSPATADYLAVPLATLDQWAYRGVGPKFYKVGKYRRYRKRDIDAWLEVQAREPQPAA